MLKNVITEADKLEIYKNMLYVLKKSKSRESSSVVFHSGLCECLRRAEKRCCFLRNNINCYPELYIQNPCDGTDIYWFPINKKWAYNKRLDIIKNAIYQIDRKLKGVKLLKYIGYEFIGYFLISLFGWMIWIAAFFVFNKSEKTQEKVFKFFLGPGIHFLLKAIEIKFPIIKPPLNKNKSSVKTIFQELKNDINNQN
jgi:hypothetical protein